MNETTDGRIIPVYKETIEYVREHGEMDAFRAYY